MKKLLVAFLLSLITILAYQNCGDIALVGTVEDTVVIRSIEPVTGGICAEEPISFTTPLKLLFIVDMSASNVGGTLTTSVGSGADPFRWTLGMFYKQAVEDGASLGGGFNMQAPASGFPSLEDYADTIIVSDGEGGRFAAIEKFVDPNSVCSGLGENLSFSLFGFSSGVLQPLNSGLTCSSPFTNDKATFSSHIDSLKRIQDQDTDENRKVRSAGVESPYTMSETKYNEGLICAAEKIEMDALLNIDSLPYYYTIFLSDGKASDQESPCASFDNQCKAQWGIQSCYSGSVPDYECINRIVIPKRLENLKTEVLRSAAGFKFQPVFYWPEDSLGVEYDKARAVLEPLAQIGGVSDVIQLGNQAALDNLENEICSTIETSMQVKYFFNMSMAVNLNARMKNGRLKADSDADGLTDELEDQLGFDKQNPRSQNGILDSLCRFNENLCNQTYTCDASSFPSGFGFNSCDIAYIEALLGVPYNGLDFNKNKILDYLELIKGSNPFNLSGSSDDEDGDEISLEREIAKGYDIESDDREYTIKNGDLMQIDFGLEPNSSSCGSQQDELSLRITSSPYVETLAANDGRNDFLSLQHEDNENIVLVHFATKRVGALSGEKERHFVAILKLSQNGFSTYSLQKSDFIELSGGAN